MLNKTYKNPVHGKPGIYGGDSPEFLTRAEIIDLAAHQAIGSSSSIENEIDDFIKWMEEKSGEKIDFCYSDLSISELSEIDNIVFTCSNCGWNYDSGDNYSYNDESVCSHCYGDLCSEDEEE